MSDSVFRIATREAIREILVENAQQGRFGLLLDDADLERASNKIVDLMETALALRSGVQERMERAAAASMPDAPSARTPTLSHRAPNRKTVTEPDEFGGKAISFPRTRNAADIYETPSAKPRESVADSTPVPPPFDVRLPRRQRISLSETERERLGGR